MLNVLNRMLRNEFECWNNGIAQSHHHSSLNWMTVLRTCCIFCEFERHKFRFDWRQCKFECWENEIECGIGCAWPKSSKLNAHKMNLVDKITKLTGKTYITNELYKCVWHESLILSLLCSLKRFASALPSGSKEEIKLILAARSYQNELIVCNGSRWLDFACWSF